MLKRIAALFGGEAPEESQHTVEAVHLATSVILLEAAYADDDFTADERRHILSVLRQRFEVSGEEAEELLALAEEARQNEASGLYRFTREINSAYSVEEKVQVVEEVWRIFYSDNELDGHEDHLARKLQNLLNLNHPTMIEAKMRVLGEIRGDSN